MLDMTVAEHVATPVIERLLERFAVLSKFESAITREKRLLQFRILSALDESKGFGARLGHVVAARDAYCGDLR